MNQIRQGVTSSFGNYHNGVKQLLGSGRRNILNNSHRQQQRLFKSPTPASLLASNCNTTSSSFLTFNNQQPQLCNNSINKLFYSNGPISPTNPNQKSSEAATAVDIHSIRIENNSNNNNSNNNDNNNSNNNKEEILNENVNYMKYIIASAIVLASTTLYLNKSIILDSSYVRNLRVIYTGAKITLYFKYYLYGLNRGDPEFAENLKKANALSAQAMVDLCKQNKGIFIKVAQILASLDHILPKEYITSLSVFQDAAPYEPFSEVERLFKLETGKHPDDIFIDFERLPINSASLAQVHRAKIRLDNGELQEVAVKVQYPELNKRFDKDINSLKNVLDYMTYLFPQFEFTWLLPEATMCLEQELDFINEGNNGERMAVLFKDNPQLSIPKVYWKQTTKRILTMEFIHGVRIDNKNGLEQLGIDFKELYYLFSNVFAEQIFIHGFLHSDPHPGNIFVRRLADGRPEIVLLDHGLYRKIDNQVRLDFCHLWKSVCLGDIKSSEYYAKRLGAGDYSKHLGTLLNLRPEESRSNLRLMRRELGDQALGAINTILKNLPKEILLVLKTNNLIRQITTHFGIENGFLLMAKTCIKGIYVDNSLLSNIQYYFTLCMFNINIKIVEFIRRRRPAPEIPPYIHHHH
ncbi:hypothetical protein CYY_003157 [Polysphondylium violaceum]|uniref:ABC1 atypical kinase-like domain-containing protein n=1 Tax=Polysphondylium violaceum TaxID=133409 RepID=A0A8J4PXF5_9MYCE|nr:hypothetical protein CYY_003157 [Polysphondylium violaceum]